MYKFNMIQFKLQSIYMKTCLILALSLFFSIINSQFSPQNPELIIDRKVSIVSLLRHFNKIFCSDCSVSTCKDNFDNVFKLSETGHFSKQSIIDNPDNITISNFIHRNTNGTYNFQGRSLIDVQMGYTMYLPVTSIPKGIILYNHGTRLGKLETPINSQQAAAIAALYTANGYVVLFPDYLGYGYIDLFPYPYITSPMMNVRASIVALNNATQIIRQNYLELASLNLFTVGYSEGAVYSVLMEKCIQMPQNCGQLNQLYEYRGAVGLNGPYDLSQTVKSFLTSAVSKQANNTYRIESQTATNFAKPSMLAMMMTSYLYYSQNKENYNEIMSEQFWRMKCTFGLPQERCQVPDTQYKNIFGMLKSYQGSVQIADSIAYSGFGKNYKGQKETYLGPRSNEHQNGIHNSVYGLVSQKLMNSLHFNQTLKKASAINYTPTKPVFVFSLLRDSVVSPRNTQQYVKQHNKTGVYYLENSLHKVCQDNSQEANVDHANGQLVANLFALSFIKNITASLVQ